MLAAETPLHRRLGERPGGRDPRGGDRGGAARVRTRAEALSLRAIVRYYHGQTPDAVRLGEQALARGRRRPAPAGQGPRPRGLPRDAARPRARQRASSARRSRSSTAVGDAARRPGPPGERPAAPRQLGARPRPRLPRTDEIERGTRADHRGRPHVGARRRRRHRLRAGAPARRPRSGDRDDRAAHPGQGRSGRRRPVQPRVAVRPPGLPRRLGGGRGVAEAAVEGYAREGADVFPSWRLRGMALVAAHRRPARRGASDSRPRGSSSRSRAATSPSRSTTGTSSASSPCRAATSPTRRPADAAAAAAARRAGPATRAASSSTATASRPPSASGDLERAERDRRLARARRAGRADALDPRHRRRVAAASSQAAAGRPRRRPRLARASPRAHDRLPMPFERGRTLLLAGQLHRRRKEKRLADERLREALAIFERSARPSGRIERGPSSPASASGLARRTT